MGQFLLVLTIVSLLIAGMAIGVIFGRKPIAGTCGGLNRLEGGDGSCSVCGGDTSKCEESGADSDNAGKADLGYDASR